MTTDQRKHLLRVLMCAVGPMSARMIAGLTDTYPATAARRIQQLIKEGVPLRKVKVREGIRGFPSVAWIMNKEPQYSGEQ